MAKKEHKHNCGKCGYFMRYKANANGVQDNQGDCANLAMNKECNENKVDPFEPWAMDEGHGILQVDENEEACGLYRETRTPRTRRLIKENPERYEQLRKRKAE